METTPNDIANLFLAAVSYSLRRGKLHSSEEASMEVSRSTERSFVLVGTNGQIIERIPLEKVLEEADRMSNKAAADIPIPPPPPPLPLPPSEGKTLGDLGSIGLFVGGVWLMFSGFFAMTVEAKSEGSLFAYQIRAQGQQSVGLGISMMGLSLALRSRKD